MGVGDILFKPHWLQSKEISYFGEFGILPILFSKVKFQNAQVCTAFRMIKL